MKKFNFLFLLPLLLIAFFSCEKDDDNGNGNGNEVVLEAIISCDTIVSPNDTVWVDALNSKGTYETTEWTVTGPNGSKFVTIETDGNGNTTGRAWFIADFNGVYSVSLKIISGEKFSEINQTITATGTIQIGGEITENTTYANIDWEGTAPDYLVTSDLIIKGATVTLENFTNFEIADGAAIIIESGSLIMSSNILTPVNNSWKGIYVKKDGLLKMANSKIDKAGSASFTNNSNQAAAIYAEGTIDVNYNAISNSLGYGIYHADSVAITGLNSNAFTSNTFGPLYGGMYLSNTTVVKNNDFSGELIDTIVYDFSANPIVTYGQFRIGSIADANILIKGIVDCRSSGMYAMGGTITFAPEAGIITSAFQANGTDGNPIVFKGQTDDWGQWKGIYVTNSVNLSWVSIEGAGSSPFADAAHAAGLYLNDYSSTNHMINNVAIKNSNGYGLSFIGFSVSSFNNNSFIDNKEGAIYTNPGLVNTLTQSSTFDAFSDAEPLISVTDYKSSSNFDLWPNLSSNYDYRITESLTLSQSKTWSIEGGTIIKIARDALLTLQGTINFSGTVTDRIVFTSDSSALADGHWYGIAFYYASSKTLNYVDVLYGGAGAIHTTTPDASIYLHSGATAVSIDNSAITNSAGYAIKDDAKTASPALNDASRSNTLQGTLGNYL